MASRTKQWIVLVVAFVVAAVVIHDRYTPYTKVGSLKDSIIQMISTEVGTNMQNSDPNGAKDPLKITEWWQAASLIKWDWEKPVEYKCGEIVKKGNRYVCMDRQFEVKPPCLVYSFGISNDWTFDDAMGNVGCEVHSFDPSIGKKSFDRSKNVHFHDIGLGARDNDTFVPTKDIYVKKATTWKIRRLKTLMEMLGHTHRHLDILKIDVETTEWSAVKDFVESGIFPKVRQLFVEWHLFTTYPSKSNYVEFYTSVKRMQELGMRTFRSKFHTKHYDDKWRLQSDVSYVNVLYKGHYHLQKPEVFH